MQKRVQKTSETSRRRNILFLMSDQHNPDYVGYAGKGIIQTPNIDRIAEGTAFMNAVSPNPVCTPARCALLTGKYTHQLNMLTMSGDLSPQHPTYARALQEAGYYTAGIGKFHIFQGFQWYLERGMGHDLAGLNEEMRKFGFDYIWEAAGKGLSQWNYCDYMKYLDDKGLMEAYRDEVERTSLMGHPQPPVPSILEDEDHVEVQIGNHIIEAIRNRPKDKPFCVFGSFLSPHPMIDPPAKYLEAEEVRYDTERFIEQEKPMRRSVRLTEELRRGWSENRAAYRALIRLVDDQIGRIFQVLQEEGLWDDTVIIYTSDHGDMLGDFGVDGKGLPYRCSAGVPLAIRHPDHLDGRRIEAPVELTDVTATILDAAGLDVKEAMRIEVPHFLDVIPSRSLMPVVRGEKERVRDFAFCEYHTWMMIRTDDRKYVLHTDHNMNEREPNEELYDLVADPDEVRNIAGDPETADFRRWCRERILQILTATPPSCLRWAPIRADEGHRGNYPGIAPYFPRKQVIREMKEARESYLMKKWGKTKG